MSSVDTAAVKRDRRLKQSLAKKRPATEEMIAVESSLEQSQMCKVTSTSSDTEEDDEWHPSRRSPGEYTNLKCPSVSAMSTV